MLEWARPLLEGALEELEARLAAIVTEQNDPVFADAHVVERFLETVPLKHLQRYMQRVSVLELNVFRVEGRLSGDDPSARFADFCRQLSEDAAAVPLWEEYVVLARLVVTQLRYWMETQVELLTHLADDLDTIRTGIPSLKDAARLESIGIGEGDRHHHGRSVCILHFDQGSVVYKPRSLTMDMAYNGLIDWINAQGLRLDLAAVTTVDRGDHGWVRFLRSDRTVGTDGVDRFAWRTGALAAILYALHATDFHFENVIADGEYPVLVDLETLLHSDKTDAVAKVEGTSDAAAVALAQSVHSTGLLPNPIVMRDRDGTHALDMSGASGHGGQLTPMPVPDWDGAETDTMRLVKRRMEMDAENNLAVAEDGSSIDIAQRRGAVSAGFSEVYDLLQRRAAELLADGGPIAAFESLHTRHIARATHVYGTVLLESTHPDFLRDGLDRDRSLARLRTGHESRPEQNAMIAAETAELANGDVPVFTIETSTGTLYGGTPPRPIGERGRPIEAVRKRIGGLAEADHLRQKWIIDAALAATTMTGKEARWPNWSQPLPSEPAEAGDFEETALTVAKRIQSLLIRGDDTIGWLGLDLYDEQHWMVAPTPLGLYNGVSGITHALDAVATVTGNRALTDEVQRLDDYLVARAHLLGRIVDDPETAPDIKLTPIGAFNETAGTVYALAHAAVRHGREDCAEAAMKLAPILDLLVDQDVSFDIVSGAAGLILVMESLEAAAPGRGALDLARKAGERLLEARLDLGDDGWAWAGPSNGGVPLNGFSHGTAGIAAAFARLNAISPDERYPEAIERALAYEASTFDRENGVWTDLRIDNPGGRTVMNAWCHGAPGIGLARRMIRDAGGHGLDLERLRSEQDRAAVILNAAGWDGDPVTGTGNHSICHGDVGNLLILDTIVDDDSIRERLPRLWKAIIADGTGNGWLCGVPHGVETPGLMTGLAGIAWGLARKADPTLVPDLLRLEAPVVRDDR
ncbi:type 2 lanthipeptide synthetase LanM family protein [Glycomyces salinus]|uniref:type 2 lanthipeptide synthetase LanM family protein n=1 Tax=Glycomyces salinus TaxID=980294 RepID=UPI0018EC49DF|nr:type 2 lanthipeptide synthetase LanM family protein [Glycomyces salinus]